MNKKYKLKTMCNFNEQSIRKIVEMYIEPPIRININNFKQENDQIAFGILKNGYKRGECFNDNHFENCMSVFRKEKNNECIFNHIMNIIDKNSDKSIYLIDGMNFLTEFMKYLVENKNDAMINNYFKQTKWGDVREFYELSKLDSTGDIEKILSLDPKIGKDKFSRNLFRINFLKDCFDTIFSGNALDLYIVFHHGFNYVPSYITGKLNRNNSDDLYKNIYYNKNYVLVSTYLLNSRITNIMTFKGRISDDFKMLLMSKNSYNANDIENIINNNITMYGSVIKQKNNTTVQNIIDKYFEYVHTNNNLSTKVCKHSNETDDYCILILYYYLKYNKNLSKVNILSNDKYGWSKKELSDENLITIQDFFKIR